MARPRRASVREEEREDREEVRSLLLVPVWLGLFLGTWWGLDRLLALAPGALRAFPALAGGARALAAAREVVAPVLGLLLGTYAIALLGELRRRLRGEGPGCEPPPEERPERRAVRAERAARDASALVRIERELDREVRAERSGLRRAALSVNNRLVMGALRRGRGPNDDIGCGGIVLLVVAATAALPFAAEALGRALGIALEGPLAALLWFAVVFGAFGVRGIWVRRRG